MEIDRKSLVLLIIVLGIVMFVSACESYGDARLSTNVTKERVERTHSVCSALGQCVEVVGPGQSECSTNSDCDQTSCTDSDGGIDYFLRGTVSGFNESGSYNFTDYCDSSAYVMEYYCSNSQPKSSFKTCSFYGPYSCLNGACVQQNSSCIIPTDGMVISEDTVLCAGSYTLPNGIKMMNATYSYADYTTLDCSGATLVGGPGYDVGIKVVDSYGAEIKNCRLRDYSLGINVDNSTLTKIGLNTLTKGHTGIQLSPNSGATTLENNGIFNFTTGVQVSQGSQAVQVLSNNFYYDDIGVDLSYASPVRVDSNNIFNSRNVGIKMKVSGNHRILNNNLNFTAFSVTNSTGILLECLNLPNQGGCPMNVTISNNEVLNYTNGLIISGDNHTALGNVILNSYKDVMCVGAYGGLYSNNFCRTNMNSNCVPPFVCN